MKRAGVLLLLAGGAALQAEGPQKLRLSLREAVEMASAPGGAARAELAREAARAAEARKRQALAPLLPNVDGSYTFRSFTNNLASFGIQFPAVPGIAFPVFVGPIDVQDARAAASLSVFDVAAIRRWQAAKAQARAAAEDREEALLKTRAAAAKAYLNAVRAEAALEAARANVALAERLLKLAESQKAAGTGTGIEVTRASAVLEQERQKMILAQEDREAARLGLLRAMNADLGAEVELTDRMVYAPAEIPPPEKALEAARELRPALKAQASREQAARLAASAAKWERAPAARAFGDYGVIGRTGSVYLPTRTAGVQVTVPLWDGGRRDARRAEAQAQERAEEIRTRDAARQVEMEIRLALEALKAAEGQVAAARAVFAQAERELEQAERRVAAGVATPLEVTEAQARLARAREAVVAAVFRQKAARIDLGAAAGNLDLMLD
jgi:outer membrane protein TolC